MLSVAVVRSVLKSPHKHKTAQEAFERRTLSRLIVVTNSLLCSFCACDCVCVCVCRDLCVCAFVWFFLIAKLGGRRSTIDDWVREDVRHLFAADCGLQSN